MDFAKKGLSIFSTDVVTHALNFVARMVLAALLGPVQLGILTLLKLIPEYSEKLGRFSLDESALYLAGKKKADLGKTLGQTSTILLGVSLLIILLSLLGWQTGIVRTWIFKGEFVPLSWIVMMLLSIPFIFLLRNMEKALLFLEDVKAYNLLTYLTPLAANLSGLLAFYYLRAGLGALLITFTVCHMIGSLVGLVLISRRVPLSFRLERETVRQLVGYGMRIYLSNAVQFLHYRIDILLVAFFLSPKEVGIYSLAGLVIEGIRKVPSAISGLLFMRSSRLSREEMVPLTLKSCRVIAGIVLVLILPCYFLVKLLLPLIGTAYLPVLDPLKILLPATIPLVFLQLLTQHYNGQGKATWALIATSLGFVTNLAGNFIWIPKYGIVGAGLASLISYSFSGGLLLWIFQRREGIGLRRLVVHYE